MRQWKGRTLIGDLGVWLDRIAAVGGYAGKTSTTSIDTTNVPPAEVADLIIEPIGMSAAEQQRFEHGVFPRAARSRRFVDMSLEGFGVFP